MTLYEKLVTIGKPYLGPATEDFLAGQCRLGLHIEPASLEPAQLRDLAHCVEESAVLIMAEKRAKDLARRIICAAWPYRPGESPDSGPS